MKTAKQKALPARKKKKFKFDDVRFREILDENCRAVVDAAYSEAVYLACAAKHGVGLMGYSGDPFVAITEMRKAMAPLIAVLEFQAVASFTRVFGSLVSEPVSRDYLRRSCAAALGKSGGRPAGARAPYIEWLETAMRIQEDRHADAIRALTAKEHFEELRRWPQIDGEDDNGNLEFSARVLDEFMPKEGEKEPVITLSAVTETLTRIRKTQK